MHLSLCILHTALPQALPIGLLLSGIGFHYFFSLPAFNRLKRLIADKRQPLGRNKEA